MIVSPFFLFFLPLFRSLFTAAILILYMFVIRLLPFVFLALYVTDAEQISMHTSPLLSCARPCHRSTQGNRHGEHVERGSRGWDEAISNVETDWKPDFARRTLHAVLDAVWGSVKAAHALLKSAYV